MNARTQVKCYSDLFLVLHTGTRSTVLEIFWISRTVIKLIRIMDCVYCYTPSCSCQNTGMEGKPLFTDSRMNAFFFPGGRRLSFRGNLNQTCGSLLLEQNIVSPKSVKVHKHSYIIFHYYIGSFPQCRFAPFLLVHSLWRTSDDFNVKDCWW